MESTKKVWAALIALAVMVTLTAALVVVTLAAGSSPAESQAVGEVPGLISYQGYLSDDEGLPLEGLVDLDFSIYPSTSGDGAIWTENQNDVPLSEGYFNVMMGSVYSLTAAHFADPERYLQVSVDTGDGPVDLPRQQIGSVPYAFQAASVPWSGLSGVPAGFDDSIDGVEYDNLVTVAKSGGDFTSIQAAVDSINDAATDNSYLIWVGPGRYYEQVVLKRYVSLQGAERASTSIVNTIGSFNDPPDTAGLTMSRNSGVRRLTILSSATSGNNLAILVPEDTYVSLIDVFANANGAGSVNYGIIITGSNTAMTINHAYIGAQNGTESNIGMLVGGGAGVTVQGGYYFARGGGADNYAIINRGNNSTLRSYDMIAEANGATDLNMGFWNTDNARAYVQGGLFKGRDGSGVACGICNGTDSHVSAIGANVEGESSTGTGYGLLNDGGTASIQGGRVYAGGNENSDAYGISNNSSTVAFAPALMVRDVFVSAFGANTCIAMLNEGGGRAMLVGGEFWSVICNVHYGVYNTGTDSQVELNNTLVNSSGGFDNFYGLYAGAGTLTRISHSELRGDDYALSVDGGSGHLQFVFLNGVLEGDAGNLMCTAVTQGGIFYDNSCPPEVP